jgi:orotidine-5'-phosphate decarboxylase
MESREKIIVALDVDDIRKATTLVEKLAPHVGCFKVGLEILTSIFAYLVTPPFAPTGLESKIHLYDVRQLFKLLEGKIFWDGKFDDIPNTIAGASRQVAKIGVRFFNVHASAGRESVRAAVINRGSAKVLGVTLLTSIDEAECISIFGDPPGKKVLQFAQILTEVGADGIICSPQELELLGQQLELDSLLKVTPGVRPEWAVAADQKRVMTPAEAVRAGADFLVIGRPITNPPPEIGTPVDAAKIIAEEVANA